MLSFTDEPTTQFLVLEMLTKKQPSPLKNPASQL